MSGDVFRWECVCGWSIERDKRAANLPEENNERIARVVAEGHEGRPRFGEKADETHVVWTTATDQ
jgi:hypothetical protein